MIGSASACTAGCNGPQAPQQAQLHQPEWPITQEAFPEDLTCGICKELFRAAVRIDKCGHSFCSFCIRLDFAAQSKKLKSKVCCPCCRADLFQRGVNKADQHLTTNLELQNQVFLFKQLQTEQEQQPQREDDDVLPLRRSSRRSNPSKQPQHQSQVLRKRNPPLTKMRAVHCQGKKRKDLVALLKSYGLPTTGSEDELKSRYSQFIMYWNSFCDEQVDPPSHTTVIQQFRSSETKKALARANTLSSTLTNHNNGASSSTTNDAEERASLLNKLEEGFQALHENILGEYAEKWMQANSCLAIAVLQSHPMIQNPRFLDCLRQRAINGNHKVPIKDLLSGKISVPDRIENLLHSKGDPSAAATTLPAMGSTHSSTAPVSQSSTTSVHRLPAPSTTFQEDTQRVIKRSSTSVPNKGVKKSRIEAQGSISATKPIAPISNPYSKRRNNNVQPTSANSDILKPMSATTAVRHSVSTTSIASKSRVQNPYSNSYKINISSPSAPKSMSSTAASAQAATKPRPHNPYSSNTNVQLQNTVSTASTTSAMRLSVCHQKNNIQGGNVVSNANRPVIKTSTDVTLTSMTKQITSSSVCSSNRSPDTNAFSNAATPVIPRNAVSPPTVAAGADIFKKTTTRTKPSWEWTCKVCTYEMKVDPWATHCAFCGSTKGATLDDAFNENQETSSESSETKLQSSSGSPNEPIELC